ncbi:MAG: hypothetical protein ACPGJS_14435 [Flammeovirgaceae bacterium]
MKFLKSIFFVAFMLCLTAGLQAQSKKKLKAENEQLKAANTVLQQKTQSLQSENKALENKNNKLKADITRMKRDSAVNAMDYKLLNDEYTDFKKKVIAERQKAADAAKGGGVDDGSITDVVLGDSNNPCAIRQAQLEAGYSYDADGLRRIRTEGYGVQVYSYRNLCNAIEKADEFMSYYRMYKTYIRVKMIGNSKVFSVVYGSLKDEQQARTYMRLFKENARVKERDSAFLIQHEN